MTYADDRRSGLLAEPLAEIGRPRALLAGTVAAVREVAAQRTLIRRLVSREIRARYKGSSLGVVWSLFRPLAQLLIYYVAIGQFLGAARSIPDFAIFVFTGLTVWSLFSELVTAGTSSIVANSGLVKKVYLPREIFPIASLGAALFNFLIQFVILVAATFIAGRPPVQLSLTYAPLSLLLIMIWGFGFSLLLSALNVYLRDVQHVVEIAMIVLFWASPIVYSIGNAAGVLRRSLLLEVYLGNPVTLAAMGMQKAMWVAGSGNAATYWPPNLWLRMLVAAAIGIVFVWFAQRVFARLQNNFAQEL